MKRTTIAIVAMLASILPAFAGYGDTVDLGQMELNHTYTLQGDYSDYVGVFTPASTGVLTVVSLGGPSIIPYSDPSYTEGISFEGDFTARGFTYNIDVAEGIPVYFKAEFVGGTYMVRLTMDEGFGIVSNSLPSGSLLSYTGRGNVEIGFTSAPVIGDVTLECEGDLTLNLTPVSEVHGTNLMIEYASLLESFLSEHPDLVETSCMLKVTGLHSSTSAYELYNGTGVLELNYTIADFPAVLDGTNAVDFTMLSYFMPDDGDAGKVYMNFSRPLMPGSPAVTLRYGNPEAEDPNEYYTENVETFEIVENEDGTSSIIIDFAGKSRRPEDIVASGHNYGYFTLDVSHVKSIDGQYTYTGFNAALGSYSYILPYTVVNTDVEAAFNPPSNSDISDIDEVTVTVKPASQIRFSGVRWAWPSEMYGMIVPKDDLTVTYSPDDTVTITAVIPEESRGSSYISLSLADFMAADGMNHSSEISAVYTSTASIDSIIDDCNAKNLDIYDLKGIRIPADNLESLAPGFYIVDGHLFKVK